MIEVVWLPVKNLLLIALVHVRVNFSLTRFHELVAGFCWGVRRRKWIGKFCEVLKFWNFTKCYEVSKFWKLCVGKFSDTFCSWDSFSFTVFLREDQRCRIEPFGLPSTRLAVLPKHNHAVQKKKANPKKTNEGKRNHEFFKLERSQQ